MKKIGVKTFDRSAGVAVGSQTRGGVDVVTLYVDMLCERFKNRGIRMSVQSDADAQKKKDSARSRLISLYPRMAGVSASDAKYNSVKVGERSCMSSEDFANYYRDLRDYKMPRFYSRAEKEYEEADAAYKAEQVQESGKPPKKAKWLAITKHAKNKIKEIPSHLNKEEFAEFTNEWFLFDKDEDVVEGEKKRVPKKVIPTVLAITLSCLLIVCSSVMVSRATADVGALEDRVDSLSFEIRDLEGKLNVKNDMLEIRRIAVEEYGMISEGFASSRYVDVSSGEKLESVKKNKNKESWFKELLRAIGIVKDEK